MVRVLAVCLALATTSHAAPLSATNDLATVAAAEKVCDFVKKVRTDDLAKNAPPPPPPAACHTDSDHEYVGGNMYGNHMPNLTSGGPAACCAMCQALLPGTTPAPGAVGSRPARRLPAANSRIGKPRAPSARCHPYRRLVSTRRPHRPFRGKTSPLGMSSEPAGSRTRWAQTRSPAAIIICPPPAASTCSAPATAQGTRTVANRASASTAKSLRGAPARRRAVGRGERRLLEDIRANLLATLPEDHGVVVLNTGVGGTGFIDGRWTVPGVGGSGCLTQNSVSAVEKLNEMLPAALGGTYHCSIMLWHQGEQDAGDDAPNQAGYCHYLQTNMGALIDYLRASFPGATAGTPFLDGGMLPYLVDKNDARANSTGKKNVMSAIYALNTSRPCTCTADSRIFADFVPGANHTPVPEGANHTPGCQPAGDPLRRSGYSHDVIHFNATMETMMGHQYWAAYQRALTVTTPVASAKTAAYKGRSGGAGGDLHQVKRVALWKAK